jgi:hypothetical protein
MPRRAIPVDGLPLEEVALVVGLPIWEPAVAPPLIEEPVAPALLALLLSVAVPVAPALPVGEPAVEEPPAWGDPVAAWVW